MPKSTSPHPDKSSRFLELLAEAEAIHVREVPANAKKIVYGTVDQVLEDFEKEGTHVEYRSFVVQVRNPLPAKPVPVVVEPPKPDRTYLLQNAKVLLDGSELLLARHIYSYLLKENIRDNDALNGLGICLLRLGDGQAAQKCFRALWELYNQEAALFHWAQCLVAEGDDKAAHSMLSKIRSPENLGKEIGFEYHKLLGNIHTRLGNLDEANRSYQRALLIQPDSDIIYVNLGTLELQRQNSEMAEMYFDRARELNTKNAKAYCGLGLTFLSRHDFEAAKNQFLEALERDPYHVIALGQLFFLAQAMDDHTFLRPRLARFLESLPKHAEAHYWLAACLYREGKWAESEKTIDKVLEIQKTHPQARKLKDNLTQNKHHA